jgi:septal ring factor EnvC (AmiA/AmiB activator)
MSDEITQRLARLEQRVDGIDTRLAELSGVKEVMAEMRTEIRHVKEGIGEIHEDIDGVNTALQARDSAVSQERRQTRLALWSLVGVLGASLITAVGAYLTAGATP